jgi:hypothetical protein
MLSGAKHLEKERSFTSFRMTRIGDVVQDDGDWGCGSG